MSGEREALSLFYQSDVPATATKEEVLATYRSLFSENISREIAAGTTLFGPHREDMDIRLGELSLRSFGSQGQQRSAVLSLKLAEGDVSRERTGEYPVFLFDDVLSELDEKRRDFLLKEIVGPQIIVTGCDSSLFSPSYAHMIEVKEGRYVSSHR